MSKKIDDGPAVTRSTFIDTNSGQATPDPGGDDCGGLRTVTLLRRAMVSGVPETSLRRRNASGRSGAFPRARVCLSKPGERPRIDRPCTAASLATSRRAMN